MSLLPQRVPFAPLLSLTVLAACGGSSPSDPVDAGTDAYVEAMDAGGTPVDAAEPPVDAYTCDLGGDPAGLATVTGSFAIIDETMGMTPPVPTGGDPVGEWVMTDATVWVDASAATMFDPEMSSLEGTAWARVTATEVTFEFDTLSTLMGTLAGTIRRPSRTAVVGTWTLDGAALVITPTCAESTGMMDPSGMASLEFQDNGDGTGLLVTRLGGMAGMTTIVWEGNRRTTP